MKDLRQESFMVFALFACPRNFFYMKIQDGTVKIWISEKL